MPATADTIREFEENPIAIWPRGERSGLHRKVHVAVNWLHKKQGLEQTKGRLVMTPLQRPTGALTGSKFLLPSHKFLSPISRSLVQ
jgi:hypothetical protein